MTLRKSSISQFGALLLPHRHFAEGMAGAGSNIPICDRCRTYCAIQLVERKNETAKVLVTCRNHTNEQGAPAEHLCTLKMTDSDWDEEELGRAIRGVKWFAEDIRSEDFTDV